MGRDHVTIIWTHHCSSEEKVVISGVLLAAFNSGWNSLSLATIFNPFLSFRGECECLPGVPVVGKGVDLAMVPKEGPEWTVFKVHNRTELALT